MRFAIFVDGSNLFGSLKHLNMRVDDYEPFFKFIFEKAVEVWKTSLHGGVLPPIELRRVYWYVVGTIDDWDMSDPKVQAHLKESFEHETDTKKLFMAEAGKKLPGATQDKVALEAWSLCFNDFKAWYDRKRKLLDGMLRFYHGVRRDTDFIEIIDTAHWKVDFFRKTVSEKGLDTAMAVDMAVLHENFDVAVLISGDADNIPSVRHIKTRNKRVAVVEFLKGYPPEKRGKNASSILKLHADFIVQVFESDLATKKLAVTGPTIIDDTTVLTNAGDS